MATIKDIARDAGVSVTTVSNVIHGKRSHVAKDTVERINRIIERYDYAPNLSARALVSKSSRIIGVINHLLADSPDCSFLQDPFHGAFIGGIECALRERGYYMMVRTVRDENELFSLFRNWNLDGVILAGIFEGSFFGGLISSDKPVVLLDSYVENGTVFNVGLEDYRGGYLATEYLIGRGHRTIAFASPRIERAGVLEERFRGYRDALEAAGIPFDGRLAFECPMTVDGGRDLGRALSSRTDVTAVFATADLLAAGIIGGLNERGARVPDDVSVMGFDDVYISRITTPQLTTVHQDAREKGTVAANMMVDYLEGKTAASRSVVLPVSIVERDSVRSV